MESSDALLGRIAIERDLIGPEQLREALRDRGAQNPPAPLGAVLVAKGFLTGEQLLKVVEEVRRRMEGGAPDGPPPPARPDLGGRYAVSGEIARGGMGVILDGQDLDIRRDLAIKVLHEAAASDPEARARFLEEAQIQGQLEHPNICPVHELGKDAQGRPYFTMKKVKGRSLFSVLEELRGGREAGTFPLARLLGVFVKVCDAVAFAHSRGVLHRDLKPHNVMLGEFGEVLVMDWGLAKVRGGREASPSGRVVSDRAEAELELSLQGSVMGTPAYMPPEQAQGRLDRIDERSDVYSLGAILYEMLTLRPPVEGDNVNDLITRAAKGAVTPPSRRAPARGVPADLEAAAMKALAPERERRYASAAALRDDVSAFLEGRTLAAAEYSLLQIAGKWLRRNRIFALTASVAALVLLAGAVVYVIDVRRARDAEAEESRRARAAESAALEAGRKERIRLAESTVAQGDAYLAARRWSESKSRYEEALGQFRKEGASTLKADLALQQFHRESPPPLTVFRGAAEGLHALAVAPDGRHILTASEGGNLRLIEAATGRERLALTGGRRIWSVAISPDGRRAVSGGDDGALKLWDLEAGRFIGALSGHESAVLAVAVSPDGARVWSSDAVGVLRAWDLVKGLPLRAVQAPAALRGLAVAPDGRRLLSGDADGRLVLWDAAKLEPLRELGTHPPRVFGVAISPDGRVALSAGDDGAVGVWDLEAGLRGVLRGHTAAVWGAAFSPDGRLAVSASFDDTVRVWDVGRGAEFRCFVGHAHDVYGAAFLPGGRRVVSASYDQTLRVWDVEGPGDFARAGAVVTKLAVSRDGLLVLGAGADGTLSLWDAASGLKLRSLRAHRGQATGVAFAPDGARALSCGEDKSVVLWDLVSGAELRRFEGHGGIPYDVAVSPDGRRAASAAGDGTVRVWSLDPSAKPHVFEGDPCRYTSLDFSPDGRRLAAGGGDVALDRGYFLQSWDLASGALSETIGIGGVKGVHSVAFSPDGARMLAAVGQGVPGDPGGTQHPLAIWGLSRRRLVRSFDGHSAPVMSAAFVAGRGLIVSGSADRTVRVWTLEDGREVRAFGAGEAVRSVAVAPDGRWFLAAAGVRILRWDLDPAEPDSDGARLAARGAWDWAAEVLGRTPKVPPLLLARCLWRTGDRAGARRELERAVAERAEPECYLRILRAALDEQAPR